MSEDKHSKLEELRHIAKACRYSSQGLRAGWRLSLSFRQEVLALIPGIILLILGRKSGAEWLLCLGAWSLVLLVELLNTALEEALNLISLDFSIQIRDAKDMASAAVFILLILNAFVWLYVFWPNLRALFGG